MRGGHWRTIDITTDLSYSKVRWAAETRDCSNASQNAWTKNIGPLHVHGGGPNLLLTLELIIKISNSSHVMWLLFAEVFRFQKKKKTKTCVTTHFAKW
jgi:hypothetical protein